MQEINIIYEDNHIIVVEKPVNIPVQQDKTNDIDMLSLIKEYIKEKYNKPGEVYLGLVHRLDRPVGGVMVFAKTSKAASRLSESIRNKDFSKNYLAVVNGKIEPNIGKLDNYMFKNEALNMSYITDASNKNAKLASLAYEVIDVNENKSLVKIILETGRHHQIRVQFANFGHSLYGDQKYGSGPKNTQIALWAYKLEFKHPTKDEIMSFLCLPKDIGIWKKFDLHKIN
jgi:23S rRNA pseudouridine1911/1915/1917 synthase